MFTFIQKIFGHYPSQTIPYSFYGSSGWYAVPGGYNWSMMVDKDGQIWVSPNALTKNSDGTVSGSPLFAAELNVDGTLVYQDQMASRKLNIDSPPYDRLSQSN